MVSSGEHYIDPWLEYKNISHKLKKRFLRKPNLAEAAREFSHLSLRFEDEECMPYAGLCHLAVARCNNQNSSPAGEAAALTKAARAFFAAEQEKVKLGLPNLHKDLASCLHCYGHAIRKHVELKSYSLAAGLCLQLGIQLVQLNRHHEAVQYFERALRFFEDDLFNKINCLKFLSIAHFECGDYNKSIMDIEQLSDLINDCGKAEGPMMQNLRDCEIATILLIMHLKALPEHLSDRQRLILSRYMTIGEVSIGESSVKWDDFILLQSMVLSIGEEDGCGADRALTQLMPNINPFLFNLALTLIDKLFKGDYVCQMN